MKFTIGTTLVLASLQALAQTPYKDTVFTEYFRRTSGWIASDATISVPLSCNKTVWLFGDSYIDSYQASDNTIPCLFQVRNSMMVQDLLNPEDFTTILDQTESGINQTPVKLKNNDTTYFWPSHGYAEKDTAIIFWQQYSGENYTHLANYFTKIYTPELDDASGITELTKLDLPSGIEFGISIIVDSTDNYIYLYGQKKDWIINRPYLARYPLGQDPLGNWEFYEGNGEWSPKVDSIQQLMGSTDDYVSPSYSVIKLQDKYYMISQENGFLTCGLGREIYSWESDTPYGPFTNKKVLYTIEDTLNGAYMITYNATAHPEFMKNNELLISYNVNGTCPSECEGDPFTQRRNADGYRPKFVRVPLTYIDPNLSMPDTDYCETVTGSIPEPEIPRFNVFPNPTETGRINIEVSNKKSRKPISITVRNTWGTIVHQDEIYTSKNEVLLPHPGIYIVVLKHGDKQKVNKVIVQK